jgi:hypothetical protein
VGVAVKDLGRIELALLAVFLLISSEGLASTTLSCTSIDKPKRNLPEFFKVEVPNDQKSLRIFDSMADGLLWSSPLLQKKPFQRNWIGSGYSQSGTTKWGPDEAQYRFSLTYEDSFAQITIFAEEKNPASDFSGYSGRNQYTCEPMTVQVAKVTETAGGDAGSVTCILATKRNRNGEIVWRTNYPNNVVIAKKKGLDCGVSESALELDAPEVITLSMLGEQRFGPEISRAQACDKALENAKQEAVRKVRGEPVNPKARGSYNEYVKYVALIEQRIEEKWDASICKVTAKVTVSVDEEIKVASRNSLEAVVTKPTDPVLSPTIGNNHKSKVNSDLDREPFFKDLNEALRLIDHRTSVLQVDVAILIDMVGNDSGEKSRSVARKKMAQEITPDYKAIETLLRELHYGPYDKSGEQSRTLTRLNGDFVNLGYQIASAYQALSSGGSETAKARSISQDSLPPALQIIGKYSDDATGFIEGRVTDNVGVVELLVNDQPIAFGTDGRFTHQEYLPTGGKEFTIVAIDRAGLKTTETVRLNREAPKQVAKVSFENLNPTTRIVKNNPESIALIVGVADYERESSADFADRDAQVFYDYAHLKLGIPKTRIQTLVNEKASELDLLDAIDNWLKRSVKKDVSDVYIFFAGHGLASDNGDTAYLIPYDGDAKFLEKSAIARDWLYEQIASVNPRSVTVFLDTCYSGDTRGGKERLIVAKRPLLIQLEEQTVPQNFAVFTAAGGDQTAGPLTEKQHGLFSYFLMKGMEGGADTNSDNQITARELHTYVRENVVQQSGGSQVPELQGDSERVLVRFR